MSKEHLNYLRRKTADEAELWAADRIEELERELSEPVILSEWQQLLQEREKLADRIEELEAAPQLSDLPSAWELWVRYSDESRHPNREWKRYGLYEIKARAEGVMKRVEGQPLELKIVPLYAVEARS